MGSGLRPEEGRHRNDNWASSKAANAFPGLCLLLLLMRHEEGTVAGLSSDDFASLVMKIGFLVFVGGGVLALFRERFSEALVAALFWVVVALVLAVGYTYRTDLRQISDRVLAE